MISSTFILPLAKANSVRCNDCYSSAPGHPATWCVGKRFPNSWLFTNVWRAFSIMWVYGSQK